MPLSGTMERRIDADAVSLDMADGSWTCDRAEPSESQRTSDSGSASIARGHSGES
jgi:hypothetical protein